MCVCVWGKWVGVLSKMIREDLSVTEIPIEKRIQLHRDLGQGSLSRKTGSAKALRREAGKHSLTFIFMVLGPFSMINILKA